MLLFSYDFVIFSQGNRNHFIFVNTKVKIYLYSFRDTVKHSSGYHFSNNYNQSGLQKNFLHSLLLFIQAFVLWLFYFFLSGFGTYPFFRRLFFSIAMQHMVRLP